MIDKISSEFNRNVFTLTFASGISQAIPVLLSPILVKIYTPEDFGTFAVFFALVSIFGSTINGKYDIATMIPKKDEDAFNIGILSLIVSFCLSILLIFIIFICFSYIDVKEFFEYQNSNIWILILPIAVFFHGIFNSLNYFNTRLKHYKDIAISKIYKSVVLIASQIALGYLLSGIYGLTIGTVLSHMSANFRLAKNIFSDKKLVYSFSLKKMKTLAVEYKMYPLYLNFANLFDIATLQMPLLFIIKIAGETINGYFFLASRIISIPSALIGKSISQVFFQRISYLHSHKEKCLPLLITTITKLLFIAIPTTIILYLFSPSLFRIIFGEVWQISGEIAKYLSLIFLIQFTVSSVSPVLALKEFVKRGTLWKIIYFISSVCLYSIVIFFKIDFFDFLFFFVIHEYILYIIYLAIIFKSVIDIDNLNYQPMKD
tara:strand:+ start:6474 stop:7766 length:1293 start_codon:yes stop_codon:yes gene_type:complete